MVGHGGSSTGSYLADPTSPIPSHCASIVATSTLSINYTTMLHYLSCSTEKEKQQHLVSGTNVCDSLESWGHLVIYEIKINSLSVNPQFEPWGLINFMFHNHPGSN